MISLMSLQKELDYCKRRRFAEVTSHIKIDNLRTEIYGSGEQKNYVPTPSGERFHLYDKSVRLVMGPYGSGKTTTCLQDIVRRACAMPRWSDGHRRKSRWAIIRNTSGELQSTTLQSWIAWFGELGDIKKHKKPILTYEHTFNDGNGIVELELLFLALDHPDDVRKLKSLELTGGYINELCEVPQAALSHLKGRVNRYPSHAFCKEKYWAGIIADTNPPEEDHWIYKDFEEKCLESYVMIKQPPGLIKKDGYWVRNPEADNAKNLPEDYYEKLAEGQTEEFIKVFCLGMYGSVGFGKKVYPEFNSDLHAVESLVATQGEPLYLGWDFGLTPACVIMQVTSRGQLLVLKEYVADGMGIRSFAESVVLPGISRDFPYNKIGRSFADPAGNARNEIMEEMSCIGELCSIGINTIAARTNDIDPRIGGVRFFLNKMIDGKPAFIMDKKNCPTLYKGFVKDYVYKRVAVSGEERYKDKPDKNMSSHPMDALGYCCLEIASDSIASDKQSKTYVDMYNPVMRAFN